jgi:hypothetical protein
MATGGIILPDIGIDAARVQSLAGSPDGTKVFYAADGVVWAKDTNGGPTPPLILPGRNDTC